MSINHNDGRYEIACWKSEDSAEDDCKRDFSEDLDAANARARQILKGGLYRVVAIYEWAGSDTWNKIEELTPDDL